MRASGMILLLGGAWLCAGGMGRAEVAGVRQAVERALPFLAEEGDWWISRKKCVSCHHTSFLTWSHDLAAQRGIAVDEGKLEEWLQWSVKHQLGEREDGEPGERIGEKNLEGLSQLIVAHGDRLSDEVRREFVNLMEKGQSEEGSWKPNGQLPRQKRPALETEIVSTLWIREAMQLVSKLGGTEPTEARKAAESWLGDQEGEEGQSTEWYVMGIRNADGPGDAEKWGRKLLERQRDDGGWSWVEGDVSDALATGQALYGLRSAGLEEGHAAMVRGVAFLLERQRENGSWATKSTKEDSREEETRVSDFWGTAWAVIGLLHALPE